MVSYKVVTGPIMRISSRLCATREIGGGRRTCVTGTGTSGHCRASTPEQ